MHVGYWCPSRGVTGHRASVLGAVICASRDVTVDRGSCNPLLVSLYSSQSMWGTSIVIKWAVRVVVRSLFIATTENKYLSRGATRRRLKCKAPALRLMAAGDTFLWSVQPPVQELTKLQSSMLFGLRVKLEGVWELLGGGHLRVLGGWRKTSKCQAS